MYLNEHCRVNFLCAEGKLGVLALSLIWSVVGACDD